LKIRNPNNEVRAFLLKLHNVIIKNLKEVNYIAQKKQNIATSKETSVPKVIRNPCNCDSFSPDKNSSFMGKREKDDVSKEPNELNTENLCSDYIDQSNTVILTCADEQPQSNDNADIKIIEIVDQFHYGIKLCMFD
jgi:hypothetical protein